MTQLDLDAARTELEELVESSTDQLIRLKNEIKLLKEKSSMTSSNWENILFDKDEQL